jgi:hypothetical protein
MGGAMAVDTSAADTATATGPVDRATRTKSLHLLHLLHVLHVLVRILHGAHLGHLGHLLLLLLQLLLLHYVFIQLIIG